MLDPLDLLALAQSLAAQGAGSTVLNQVCVRRAISTAYYALFHHALREAADRFVGADARHLPAYTLLYRGFEHGRMRQVCKAIDKPQIAGSLKTKLNKGAVSQPLRDFASMFIALQELRHVADYNPSVSFLPSEARDACDGAQIGIDALSRAGREELTDVFALILAGGRD